ncbi:MULTISPECIES: biotin transporter BioY [Limibacillus]|jgi:biotin transport system substrate-specific component|uniref:Biotin transporter n=1 Tax=Limibacillus halophilus TaxID=1579333 RepID=A0A839SS47_9PROT|nr:biotin transporter BioY [Limibacillus halophilus]MBB3065697.1 biotin transport system substrate-specific component [Limibacillus halophilus]
MTTYAAGQPALSAVIWPASDGASKAARALLLVVVGSLALAVSAKVKVPFYPVDMTMQTFVVMVLAMAYGWRLGMATVALYLAEGLMGLPVFTGTPERGLGLAYMLGTTGGYLVGMLVAAGIVGWLAERGFDRNVGSTLVAMMIGTFVIFALGLAWLASLIGFDKAITFGLMPFLYSEALKIALAAVLMPLAWKLMALR